jgi:hypothetical protein
MLRFIPQITGQSKRVSPFSGGNLNAIETVRLRWRQFCPNYEQSATAIGAQFACSSFVELDCDCDWRGMKLRVVAEREGFGF